MRNAFQRALLRSMNADKNVMLVTGDLGYSVLEPFRDGFPKQYVNCGVAEQSMMGIAAGLAMSGKNVFAYSIAPFASLRALEQVRDDIAYQNLPVKIISVGGGFSYGHQGVTHCAIEDIAIMRAIPNMAVVCPVDPYETEAVIDFAVRHEGPMYIRLGKAGEKNLFKKPPKFAPGRFSVLSGKGDVALFATGPLTWNALEAMSFLRAKGIPCRIIAASSVKPIDRRTIRKAAQECRLLVSVEEHNVMGGLGGAIAEVLAEGGSHAPLLRLGVPDVFLKKIGSQEYLRDYYNLSPKKIADAILRRAKRNR